MLRIFKYPRVGRESGLFWLHHKTKTVTLVKELSNDDILYWRGQKFKLRACFGSYYDFTIKSPTDYYFLEKKYTFFHPSGEIKKNKYYYSLSKNSDTIAILNMYEFNIIVE